MTCDAELWIGGKWQIAGGKTFVSHDPSDGSLLWQGGSANEEDVDSAFRWARQAFAGWSRTDRDVRIQICRDFAALVQQHREEFARTLSAETGKPLWEAGTEVSAVAGKIELAISALSERRDTTEIELSGHRAVTRYRPHGVLGVLGPFNLPAHLPNGHIVPAILAGNVVVFKPSELTPAVGQFMARLWDQAGLPEGVINLVQGGRDTGAMLVGHDQLDGLLFTGSSRAGVHFLKCFAENPEKILALEMGGNNPLIVHQAQDITAAAYQVVLSAFLTAGQRCTCARRLIVVDNDDARSLVEAVKSMIARLRVGLWRDEPEPFMGTVISPDAAQRVLAFQRQLMNGGGKSIVEARLDDRSPALVHPGLIDVTEVESRTDEECFGPLLQVIRVGSFEEAIEEANRSRYGLSAGLISDDRSLYEEFSLRIRAGVVNWNRQITGASGRLPFGGVGLSGNHRPSGYFAADYCSFPVASLESDRVELPDKLLTGIDPE